MSTGERNAEEQPPHLGQGLNSSYILGSDGDTKDTSVGYAASEILTTLGSLRYSYRSKCGREAKPLVQNRHAGLRQAGARHLVRYKTTFRAPFRNLFCS